MKQEIINRAVKNITYERVCGYLVRVERCREENTRWKMKQEIINRAVKNITYERVCGYLVRVERCDPGVTVWKLVRDTAAVLFCVAACLVWLFF